MKQFITSLLIFLFEYKLFAAAPPSPKLPDHLLQECLAAAKFLVEVERVDKTLKTARDYEQQLTNAIKKGTDRLTQETNQITDLKRQCTSLTTRVSLLNSARTIFTDASKEYALELPNLHKTAEDHRRYFRRMLVLKEIANDSEMENSLLMRRAQNDCRTLIDELTKGIADNQTRLHQEKLNDNTVKH